MRTHRTHLAPPKTAALALVLTLALTATLGLGGCGPTVGPARAVSPGPGEDDSAPGLLPLGRSTPSAAPRPRPGCRRVTGDPAKWSHRVQSVELRGLGSGLRTAGLKCLQLTAGSPYDQHRVGSDVRCLWGLGAVKNVWVEGCKVPGGIAVTYGVQPEPRVRQVHIQVRHPDHRRWFTRSVGKLWRQRKHQRLSRKSLRYDLKTMRAAYRERGYWSARIRPYVRPAGAGWVDLVLRIRTGPRVAVGRVTLQGNRTVATGALRKILHTQPGSIYREVQLQRDLLRIQHHYYDRGYINVRVREPSVVLSPCKRFLNISIRIREGKTFRLGRITLAGALLHRTTTAKTVLSKDPQAPNHKRAQSQLSTRVQSRPGQQFSRSRLAADIRRVIAWYKKHGYISTEVAPETSIDLKGRLVHLTLKVTPGERLAVQQVRVRGQAKVSEAIIRSLLDLGPGDVCDFSKMHSSHRRLLETGLFGHVTVRTLRGRAKDLVVLEVVVVER